MMKQFLWCALLYIAFPLCAMDSAKQKQSSAYDGVPDAGQQAARVIRKSPAAPVPSQNPSRKHPDKISDTKRRDQKCGKGPQARNKDLIAKTRFIRTVIPTTLAFGAAALAVSEHKARRAGKQTMLQRLWYKICRAVRGKTGEAAREQKQPVDFVI